MGLIGTTVLGIVGALLGGWLGQAFGWYGPDDGAGFFAATIGAVVVLLIYNFAVRRSGTVTRSSNTTPIDRDRAA
jgi:uncharacterized membrane protein YeaQ/YmgE (transglycosylase-associated protein family)